MQASGDTRTKVPPSRFSRSPNWCLGWASSAAWISRENSWDRGHSEHLAYCAAQVQLPFRGIERSAKPRRRASRRLGGARSPATVEKRRKASSSCRSSESAAPWCIYEISFGDRQRAVSGPSPWRDVRSGCAPDSGAPASRAYGSPASNTDPRGAVCLNMQTFLVLGDAARRTRCRHDCGLLVIGCPFGVSEEFAKPSEGCHQV